MTAPDIATPAMRAAFLRVVAAHAPGQTLGADSIRDDAKAGAQIPGAAMGGLFKSAKDAGYIFHAGFTPSTHPAARGRWVMRWKRTSKPVVLQANACVNGYDGGSKTAPGDAPTSTGSLAPLPHYRKEA
jgi:hypothetical protein